MLVWLEHSSQTMSKPSEVWDWSMKRMSFEEKKTHTSPLCKDSWQTGSNVNFLGEVIYMQNAMNVNECPP